MKNVLVILIVCLFFAGCETTTYLQCTNGSKAAGTLTYSYEYGAFQKPIVQWEQAKEDAILKCKNWGYSGAQFFGSGYTEVIAVNGYGNAVRWRVTYQCQCTN